jgi:hypothetical protein
VAEIEIRHKGRQVERFSADVDPRDEIECVALLRRRARELRLPLERLSLVVWAPRVKRITYRA